MNKSEADLDKYRINTNEPIEKEKSNFGKWSVSKKGDLSYDNGRYEIGYERLNNDDWILHLLEKRWIDWNKFIPAYFQALENANIQFVKIKIYY